MSQLNVQQRAFCCQSLKQKFMLTIGQDLSKEVLWVSVGQRAAINGPSNFEAEGDPNVQEPNQGCPHLVRLWPSGRIFFKPPTLTACKCASP